MAGKEGVKQYRLLRQTALYRLGLGIGDQFHDTKSVLPEVTEWHKYLRTCIRGQDYYTSKVLDIVDSSMLITSGEMRVSGSDLKVSLSRIKASAAVQCKGQPQPPENILDFLDGVMASTGAEHLPALADIPRTISQSGADMFEEALLYPSLRSEGRPPLPRQAGALRTTFGQHIAVAIDPVRMSLYQNMSFPSPLEPGLRRPDLPKIRTVSSSEAPAPANLPITFWEVEAQLEQQSKAPPGFINRLGRMIGPSSKLMENRDDQLAKHFLNRDLVSSSTNHELRDLP